MARQRITSFLLIALYFIVRVISIVGTAIYRALVALVITVWGFGQAAARRWVLLSTLLVIFLVGLALQLAEEEIRTVADEAYECGIFPPAEFIANAAPFPLVRVPSHWWAEQYNNIMLFLFDGIDSIIGDIRTLVRIKRIVSNKAALGAVKFKIFGEELQNIADIFNDIGAFFINYFAGWGNFFVKFWNWLVDLMLAWFIRFDAFNLSCTLCSLDPDANCELREPWLPDTPDYDCNDCHELTADGFGLIGALLDAVTGNFVSFLSGSTSFERIFRALACPIRSTILSWIQMWEAIAEQCFGNDTADRVFNVGNEDSMIFRWFLGGDPNFFDCGPGGSDSQACCGKPDGCVFPDVDSTSPDLPIGVGPCILEIFNAITNNEGDDWLFIILGFLAKPVADVVKTVDRSIECAGDPRYQACLDTFIAQDGSFPEDDGMCGYNDDDVVPDGGLHECFSIVHDCLANETADRAPLLVDLVGPGTVFEFLLGDFWRYTIDFVVCAFVTLIECFDDVNDFDEAVTAMIGLNQCSPLWAPVFKPLILILQFFQNTIGAIQADIDAIFAIFRCLEECWEDPIFPVPEVESCEDENCDDLEEISECFRNGDGCEDELPTGLAENTTKMPHADAMRLWLSMMEEQLAVPKDSYCWRALAHTTPKRGIRLPQYSARYMYYACFGLYGGRRKLASRCRPGIDTGNMTAQQLGFSDKSDPLYDMAHIYYEVCDTNTRKTTSKARPGSRFATPNFNLTVPRAFFANKTSNWWNRIGESAASPTNWTITRFFTPMWESIKTTRAYVRTSEFQEAYTRVQRDTHARDAASIQAHLDEIYLTYANDMLSLHRTRKWRNETRYDSSISMDESAPSQYYSTITNKVYEDATLEGLSGLRDKVWKRMGELHIIEPEEGQIVKPITIDPRVNEVWTAVNDATKLEYKPWFQFTAGLFRAIRARNGTNAVGIMSGRLKFLTSENRYVNHRIFERQAPPQRTSTGQPVPTLASVWTGTSQWQARRPRVYAPFPIPIAEEGETMFGGDADEVWYKHATGFNVNMRERYQRTRAERAKVSNRTPRALEDFDANQWIYDLLDGTLNALNWIANLFTTLTGVGILLIIAGAILLVMALVIGTARRDTGSLVWVFFIFVGGIVLIIVGSTIVSSESAQTTVVTVFNDLVDAAEEVINEVDFRNFTNESVEQYFLDLASCKIPENIDGTEPHSTFCLFLLREDPFALFSGISETEGAIRPQIQWPQSLIDEDCVTIYNGEGADDIFVFEFSNNCLLPAAESTSANCVSAGCAGTLAFAAREVAVDHDVIEYEVAQSGASCAVLNLAFPIPNCAAVTDVAGACITGYDSNANTLGDEEGCAPGFDGTETVVQNVMVVNTSFPVDGTCTFRITFDEGVEFSAGASRVFVNQEGVDLCDNCTLRMPAGPCLGSDPPPADFYHDRRPFCENPGAAQCDYCHRTHKTCGEAGMADWIDSLFYLTGRLPHAGDEVINSGIPVKLVEDILGPWIFLVAMIITAPLLLACCCGSPCCAVVVNFGHLPTWILFVSFGPFMPYPLVFLIMTLYVTFRNPSMPETVGILLMFLFVPDVEFAPRIALVLFMLATQIPAIESLFAPVFWGIYATFAVWILSLVFTFPLLGEVLNINQALSDFLVAINNQWWLFFVDTKPLNARLQRFIYPTAADVPEAHDFCFWWNLANLAILTVVITFALWPIRLLFRWLFVFFLMILDFIWAVFDARRAALMIWVRQLAATAKENAAKNKDRVDSLWKKTKDGFEDAKKSFVRKLISAQGASIPPELQPTNNTATPDSHTLDITPRVDETHSEFMARRAMMIRELREARAAQAAIKAKASDDDSSASDDDASSESDVDGDDNGAGTGAGAQPTPTPATAASHPSDDRDRGAVLTLRSHRPPSDASASVSPAPPKRKHKAPVLRLGNVDPATLLQRKNE